MSPDQNDPRSPGQRPAPLAPSKGKAPKGAADNSANSSQEPPDWAKQLLLSLELINSRVGLLESGAIRPSFSKAASDSTGGVQLTPSTENNPSMPSSGAPANRLASNAGTAPKMGQSGSGYTLLPNGKMVRNKRPSHKPLNLRQAANWRSKATTSLVTFLKQEGVSPGDPKPVTNPVYRTLVLDLANAKEYYSFVKNGGTLEVQDWKNQSPQITWDSYIRDNPDILDEEKSTPPPGPTRAQVSKMDIAELRRMGPIWLEAIEAYPQHTDTSLWEDAVKIAREKCSPPRSK